MKSDVCSRLTIGIATIVIGFTTYAQAGPPLICHRIEIEQARSLPLIEWNQKDTGSYDLRNLSRDTLAILNSDTPVLVRMETLRRATIYVRHDPQVANQLLTRITHVPPSPTLLAIPTPWHGLTQAILSKPTSSGSVRANPILLPGLTAMTG